MFPKGKQFLSLKLEHSYNTFKKWFPKDCPFICYRYESYIRYYSYTWWISTLKVYRLMLFAFTLFQYKIRTTNICVNFTFRNISVVISGIERYRRSRRKYNHIRLYKSSWLITGFLAWTIRRVLPVEKELQILWAPEATSDVFVFSEARVA